MTCRLTASVKLFDEVHLVGTRQRRRGYVQRVGNEALSSDTELT